MIKIIRWLSRVLPSRMIYCDHGVPYLFRAKFVGYLPGGNRNSKFNLYLHDFYRDDLDRHLHNHPWLWSVSFVLSGGYTEERMIGGKLVGNKMIGGKVVTRRVRPLTFNILMPGDFHRIIELHGEVWTLFGAGPKFDDWGFLIGDTVIPHKQFQQEKRK